MTTCDYNHDEIVHTERRCPLCEAIKEFEAEKERMQTLLTERDDRIAELESQVESRMEVTTEPTF